MSESKKITSRKRLKEYFGTGKYPTGEQFGELIDSLGHRGEEALDGGQYFNVSQLHSNYDIDDIRTAVAALVAYLGEMSVEVKPGAVVAFCCPENGVMGLREYYWTGRIPLNNPETWQEMTSPRAQTTRDGDARHFVYSIDDPQSKASVLNAPDTLLRKANGELRFQKGIWNPEKQSIYYTGHRVPVADSSGDGAMSKDVFGRLGSGASIREGTATLTEVPVIYPNWAEGGTRTFMLNHATSARAGVMTAADKNKLDGVLDLGVVTNSDAAFRAAAAIDVVSNPQIRVIIWRTSDSKEDGGRGAGGTIFQERYGNWYVTQWMMFEGSQKICKVRTITTGGNYSCGNWQSIVLPTSLSFNASTGAIMWGGANDSAATRLAVVIPPASVSARGLMSVADKQKLDALPAAVGGKGWSTFDFNREWLTKLSNAGIYGRNANQMRAVNGVFSLAAGATDSQIKAALTEYSTKSVLTRTDLEYCADNGCELWDEQTQGFVQVTHNGGGFFNLVELSMGNYQELPKLRFVGLRALDNGTWTVTRPGQQERICYKSEFDALAARVTALEGRES